MKHHIPRLHLVPLGLYALFTSRFSTPPLPPANDPGYANVCIMTKSSILLRFCYLLTSYVDQELLFKFAVGRRILVRLAGNGMI